MQAIQSLVKNCTKVAILLVLIGILVFPGCIPQPPSQVTGGPSSSLPSPTESYPAPQATQPAITQYPPPFQPTMPALVPTPVVETRPTSQTNDQYPAPYPTITPAPTYAQAPGPTLTSIPLPELPKDASGVLTYVAYTDKSSAVILQRSMDAQGQPDAEEELVPVQLVSPPEFQMDIDFANQFILYAPDGRKAVMLNQPGYSGRYFLDLVSGKLENLQADFEIYDIYEWFPDGQTLLVNHNSDILMNFDPSSGKHTNFASTQLGSILGAAVSPDGSQMVYSNNHFGLYIVDHNGQNQRQIFTSELGIDGLAWSPDGKRIVFLENGWMTIYPDGSDLRKFEDSNFPHSFRPAAIWSPDSRYVVVPVIPAGFVDPNYGDPNELPNLYLLDTEMMQAAPLLPDAKGGLLDPAWSPDGSHLVFAYNLDGNYQIWTLRLADGDLQQVTFEGGSHRFPKWFANNAAP